jgi:hypothetical protein
VCMCVCVCVCVHACVQRNTLLIQSQHLHNTIRTPCDIRNNMGTCFGNRVAQCWLCVWKLLNYFFSKFFLNVITRILPLVVWWPTRHHGYSISQSASSVSALRKFRSTGDVCASYNKGHYCHIRPRPVLLLSANIQPIN